MHPTYRFLNILDCFECDVLQLEDFQRTHVVNYQKEQMHIVSDSYLLIP